MAVTISATRVWDATSVNSADVAAVVAPASALVFAPEVEGVVAGTGTGLGNAALGTDPLGL